MTKQVHYDQGVVNQSLENTFEIAADDPTKNNQTEIKKPGRGGKRPGSGRKVGSTNKIQGVEFLEEYKKIHGSSLKEDLARDMMNARLRGDFDMLFKYQTAFAKYYFADTAEQKVDVTSKGETLGVQLVFTSKELPDWKK
jgi:hypothetical protein